MSDWLFRNSSVEQLFPENFQTTSVRVLFSTNEWGLPDKSVNSLGAFFYELQHGYQRAQNFGIPWLSLPTSCYQNHCMCMIVYYFP